MATDRADRIAALVMSELAPHERATVLSLCDLADCPRTAWPHFRPAFQLARKLAVLHRVRRSTAAGACEHAAVMSAAHDFGIGRDVVYGLLRRAAEQRYRAERASGGLSKTAKTPAAPPARLEVCELPTWRCDR